MKKLFFLLLCACELIGRSNGQVSHQTGSAQLGIPIFEWADKRSRLNSFVSLSYNSGNGLKVGEVASNIGQGWDLMAGGSITRLQAGEPDDQKPRDGAVEDETKYPAGYLYHNIDPLEGCPGALTRYPLFRDKNHIYKQHNSVAADLELDQFVFNCNGKTGIFVLGRNYGDVGVWLEDSRMKVWFIRDEGLVSQGIRTTITTFYVQDVDGVRYKFSQHEKTKTLRTRYCKEDLTTPITQPAFKGNRVYHETSFDNQGVVNPYVITAWHLSEVEDMLTGRKIVFDYTVRQIDSYSGKALTYYQRPPGLLGAETGYVVVSHGRSISQTPVLSSITYPDGYSVNFNYSGTQRIDLPGDYPLSTIDVLYYSRHNSRHELGTTYFIKNRLGYPVTDYQKKYARLALRSVKKYSVDLLDSEEPYRFDYYTGSNAADDYIPDRFTVIKDIWGFYNGTNSKTYTNTAIDVDKDVLRMSVAELKGLCFMRENETEPELNPKSNYARNGLIKQIVFPTGNVLKYEYGQNKAVLNGQEVNVGGVHVTKTTVMDASNPKGCDEVIVSNYSFVQSGTVTSSLWGIETPKNSLVSTSYYEPESKYFYYKPIANFGCEYRYKYPGILSRDQAVDLTSGQRLMVAMSKVLNVVGSILQIKDIINLCISGTPANWVAVILDVVTTVFNIVITCVGNHSKTSVLTLYYNTDLNGGNPLPSQFGRVEVTEGAGGNGKSVFEFTTPTDYPLWELSNPSLSKIQRYAHWAYGLLKKSITLDASGVKTSETENVYDYTYAKDVYFIGHAEVDNQSCKCLVTKSTSQRYTDWGNPSVYASPATPNITSSTADMQVKIYPAYHGRVTLQRSYERSFKPGSSTEFLETITDYEYDPISYAMTDVVITGSDDKKQFKHFRYSDMEYSSDPVTAELYDNNMLYEKVNENSGYVNAGAVYGFNVVSADIFSISEKVTEWKILSNGDIKPYRIWERKFSQPRAFKTDMSSRYYPGMSDFSNYVLLQTFLYGTDGQLMGVRDGGNRSAINLYGYFNNDYVVGAVVNADAETDKVAYTSFEKFGTPGAKWFGPGWSLDGITPGAFVDIGVTGNNAYRFNGTRLMASRTAGKPYILSFWSTSSNITITEATGATLSKSAPTINGFTYYEYKIPAAGNKIGLLTDGTIDELRLYPVASRMTTLTLDPLIGKTSTCDENNRIEYYEYDDMGRLRYVRDDKRNIIKMLEYNSRKPQCESTYSNAAVSEIFRKECGPGYIGSEVVYTIAAGKYTSTISQEIVDKKVELELLALGQAYANTNGTCIPVFTNVAMQQNFTKEGCDPGYTGTTITYSVPAGRYTSLISQQDADDQALEEIDANGQAYANSPGNASCVPTTTADWVGTGEEQCQDGHKMIQVKDQNPNSSTYNQLQWIDTGVDESCPQGCSFTAASGWTISSGSLSPSGTNQVTMFLNISYSGSYTNWSVPLLAATILGPCRPSVSESFTFSEGGRTWRVIIEPSGNVLIKLESGSAPGSSFTLHIPSTTYSL